MGLLEVESGNVESATGELDNTSEDASVPAGSGISGIWVLKDEWLDERKGHAV